MKGSKKRAAPSEDAENPNEKQSAKKHKATPQKGQEQNLKSSNVNQPPASTSKSVQCNDNATKNPDTIPGAQTTLQENAVASSSREPIVNADPPPASERATVTVSSEKQRAGIGKGKAKQENKKYKVRKLAPRRPFPTVPTSVSATGPRSAHTEGKNHICVTRKTQLGAYLRRCKELILKDGYKTIHLHAMGAAITHLSRLVVSLPTILPYPKDEIHTEIRTGTAEVHDEIIPDDEDEDISMRKRDKSTLAVIIRIGDGDVESGKQNGARGKTAGKNKQEPEQVIVREGDQEDDQMVA